MKKAVVLILLIVVMFSLLFVAQVSASPIEDLYENIKGDKSIAEQITTQGDGPSETEILALVDERVSDAVATIRVLATIFAVLFLIWMGIILFTAGDNPQRLAAAKTKLVFALISMLFIFLAEPIVRFVMSWFLTGGS